MTRRRPKLAVDCIILLRGKVLLIRRRNPPRGWALPGGFVEYGETVEAAVRREMMEETGLELEGLEQFRVYSDPARDPRGHTVSVVFVARGRGKPSAGDDALSWRLVDPAAVRAGELVFDHARILRDFAARGAPRTGRRRAGTPTCAAAPSASCRPRAGRAAGPGSR